MFPALTVQAARTSSLGSAGEVRRRGILGSEGGTTPSFWDGYGISHCKDAIQSNINGQLDKFEQVTIDGISVFYYQQPALPRVPHPMPRGGPRAR
jgi:hypothetical protein